MGDQGQGQGQGMEVDVEVGAERVVKKRTPIRAAVKQVWEIPNLSDLVAMSEEDMEKHGISFDAGQSIGIPATWRFYLTHSGTEDEDSVGGYLHLSSDSKAKSATASYSIAFSCDGKTFIFQDFEPYEFKVLAEGGEEWGLDYSEILQKTDQGKKILKITLCVKVYSEKGVVEKTSEPSDNIFSDFAKLLESGDGADVEVRVPNEAGGEVDDTSYKKKVHKGILMARSSVFAAMFAQESEMVEAETGKVVIKDLSPEGLGVFLHYIYTGKVLDEWAQVPEEILNAADKYDLRRLKNHCGHNIMAAVTPKNALEMYQLVKLHKLSFAKSLIAEFVSKNSRAILDDDDDPISDDDSYEEPGEHGEDE